MKGRYGDYQSIFSYSGKDMAYSPPRSAFTYSGSNPVLYSMLEESAVIDKTKEETLNMRLIRFFITYLSYFIILASLPISFWFCVKRIHALERLIVLRLGKLQPQRGPGYCFVIPFLDKWTIVDLKPKVFAITNEQVLTADGGIVLLSVSVQYSISKSVHYVTKLYNQDKAFQSFALHCIRNYMSQMEQSALEKEKEEVASSIKTKLNNTAIGWGLEILNVEISAVKILKESEQQGTNAVMNVLRAITSDWSSNSEPSAACNVQSTVKNNTQFSEVVYDDAIEATFEERVTTWLEQKGYDNGLNFIADSFELKICRGNNILSVFYVHFMGGSVYITKEPQSSTISSCVMMMEEDVEDLIGNKITILQLGKEGKIQIKTADIV